jgi:serine/threonine-protein kinase RsbW
MTATVRLEPDGHDPPSGTAASTMRLDLAWRLPRLPPTVSMVRRLLNTALIMMRAPKDCRADIALAITEACANAVCHAHDASEYEVIVAIRRDRCVVEVIDNGVGLDRRRLDGAVLDGACPDVSDRGRGLRLIRACTDTVDIRPGHPRGLTIQMSKKLTRTDAPPII